MEAGANKYGLLTYCLALMALVWMPAGYYLFEVRGIFFDMSDYLHGSHWGGPFHIYHSGIILLLSGIGVLIGIAGIRKSRAWSTGFFINTIVFTVIVFCSF